MKVTVHSMGSSHPDGNKRYLMQEIHQRCSGCSAGCEARRLETVMQGHAGVS
jgi:hypothetical protein